MTYVVHVLLITGDRDWDDRDAIRSVLRHRAGRFGVAGLLVVTGDAPGADTIAVEEGQEMGIHVARIAALWKVYRAGAGPVRNRIMLALEPDEVVAFHNNLLLSKGTRDMVTIALAAGIPTKLWGSR